MEAVGCPPEVAVFGEEPPQGCPKGVSHAWMSGRGDVGAQSKAGVWVGGLRQDVNDLLYILNI